MVMLFLTGRLEEIEGFQFGFAIGVLLQFFHLCRWRGHLFARLVAGTYSDYLGGS